MNLFEPDLSRRMARVVQTMPSEIKDEFIEAIKKAPSKKQIAQPFRSYLEKGYKPEIDELDKNAGIYKNNPNRDSRGRFTFGSGGPQASGGGGAGGEEGREGAGGGSGGTGEPGEGKDITSELGAEYGTTSETKRGAELRAKDMAPETRGDPTLQDIANKQGFDGKAEMVDQEAFDQIVAEGGTVTYRGVTDYYDSYSANDAKYISGDTQISEQFAEGPYFGGIGGYGSGTYTSSDVSVAQHYAFEDGAKGGVITMVVKPNAKIATPQQWQAARTAAREGTGGFMGANNEGRILAAQGFDGFRIASKDVDHFSNQFVVVLNRNAVAVLKK
jgi:hypothetical protein